LRNEAVLPSVILLNRSEAPAELRHLVHYNAPNLDNILDDSTIERILDRGVNISKELLKSIDKTVLSLINSSGTTPITTNMVDALFTTALGELDRTTLGLESFDNAPIADNRLMNTLRAVSNYREKPISLNSIKILKDEITKVAEFIKTEAAKSNIADDKPVVAFKSATYDIIKIIDQSLKMLNSGNSGKDTITKQFITQIMSEIGLTYENDILKHTNIKSESKPIAANSFKGALISLLNSTDSLNSYLGTDGDSSKELLKEVTNQLHAKIHSTINKLEGGQILSEKRVVGDKMEQNLQLPLNINGEMTIVNFKIERDKEGSKKKNDNSEFSKVEIYLDLEGCGEIKSKLEFTNNKVLKVSIESIERKSAYWFRKNSSDIMKSLEKEGVNSVIFNSVEVKRGSIELNRARSDSFVISG
jgi:hypothetical protein